MNSVVLSLTLGPAKEDKMSRYFQFKLSLNKSATKTEIMAGQIFYITVCFTLEGRNRMLQSINKKISREEGS